MNVHVSANRHRYPFEKHCSQIDKINLKGTISARNRRLLCMTRLAQSEHWFDH